MSATQVLIGLIWLPALVFGIIGICYFARCLIEASKECEYPDLEDVE